MRWRRIPRWIARGVGVAVVAGLAAAAVHVLWDANVEPRYHRPDPAGVALAILASASLLFARRRPLVVLTVSCAATLALTWVGYSRWVAAIGPALAATAIIAVAPPLVSATAVAAVFLVVAIAVHGDPYISGWLATALLYAAGAIMGGLLLRLTSPEPTKARPVTRGLPFFLVAAILTLGVVTLAVTFLNRYADTRTSIAFPNEILACRGVVTEQCASVAATRSRRPVAWLPPAPGTVSLDYVADGSAVDFQQIRGKRWFMSLYSSPLSPPPGPPRSATEVGSEPAEVFLLATATTETDYAIEWSRSGVRYRAAVAILRRSRAGELSDVLAVLSHIQYRTP